VPNQILLVTHLSPARKFALWRILTNFCHVKNVTILLDDIIMNHINVYLPLADHEAITEREVSFIIVTIKKQNVIVMYLPPYAFIKQGHGGLAYSSLLLGRCKFFSFWHIQIWLAR
ncbi:hypothetical protein ACJX0J_035819, partial [Zea mays]